MTSECCNYHALEAWFPVHEHILRAFHINGNFSDSNTLSLNFLTFQYEIQTYWYTTSDRISTAYTVLIVMLSKHVQIIYIKIILSKYYYKTKHLNLFIMYSWGWPVTILLLSTKKFCSWIQMYIFLRTIFWSLYHQEIQKLFFLKMTFHWITGSASKCFLVPDCRFNKYNIESTKCASSFIIIVLHSIIIDMYLFLQETW